ncbi:class I SAM-dependent methyltransferase [Aspergillus melleus]|uniref:class I SAM-dependent methyltransferase n=1 Tax=Aspergillus melleus TaxID=138277 RepID=UPI001E8CFC4C|nr:uncharacterized protein LDX57_007648 [Aspergillus melleus]KAH8429976.1 hypothetical protein LDX57_007648 [Aspergillus melleus]
MDSAILNQLFRQLFRHPACQCPRPSSILPARRPGTVRFSTPPRQQSRTFISRMRRKMKYDDSETLYWTRREDYPLDFAETMTYPLVTAKDLRRNRERPRRIRMLTREFIDGTGTTKQASQSSRLADFDFVPLLDSLYNPHYGYFTKHATIFSPGEPFQFNQISDGPSFHQLLEERYTEFEDRLDLQEPDIARQLWHTPTELFRPYYGETLARYLVSNYKLTLYPYHDLIIYEMGAGNGTLMINMLDFIRDTDYEVYQRTKFRIIEISPALADLQFQNLKESLHAAGHIDHVEIINRSIFDWDTYVHSPCFFLAMEVFDNFSHDAIRYNYQTEMPQQGGVVISESGEFNEYYNTQLDPLAARFLRVRQAAAQREFPSPLGSKLTRPLHRGIAKYRDIPHTLPEYIPTRLMQFFDILNTYFPGHRLLTSDFSTLPNAIPGLNGPVVQTRYKRRTVPVSTPFVQQGFFDIFFPTDFDVVEDLYRAITGKLTQTMSHEDFMRRWAYIEDTETRNGENPLLSWYKNASVMMTV